MVAMSARAAPVHDADCLERARLEHWQATLEVLSILEDFAATLVPAGDVRACPNPVLIDLLVETRAELFALR